MDIIIEKFLINLRSDSVLKNHLIVKIDEYKKKWYPPNTGFYHLPTDNPLEFTYESNRMGLPWPWRFNHLDAST